MAFKVACFLLCLVVISYAYPYYPDYGDSPGGNDGRQYIIYRMHSGNERGFPSPDSGSARGFPRPDSGSGRGFPRPDSGSGRGFPRPESGSGRGFPRPDSGSGRGFPRPDSGSGRGFPRPKLEPALQDYSKENSGNADYDAY